MASCCALDLPIGKRLTFAHILELFPQRQAALVSPNQPALHIFQAAAVIAYALTMPMTVPLCIMYAGNLSCTQVQNLIAFLWHLKPGFACCLAWRITLLHLPFKAIYTPQTLLNGMVAYLQAWKGTRNAQISQPCFPV